MSDQDNIKDEAININEEEWLSPALQIALHLSSEIIQASINMIDEHISHHYLHMPYHTSSLSGEDWVQELLTRHPWCIQNELSLDWGTFLILIKALQVAGLQSSHHVSIEEQLVIFLYTTVTGMSSIHVGECFQWSWDTITK